jgi:hypothetical protein
MIGILLASVYPGFIMIVFLGYTILKINGIRWREYFAQTQRLLDQMYSPWIYGISLLLFGYFAYKWLVSYSDSVSLSEIRGLTVHYHE